jgi:hypothetical protein
MSLRTLASKEAAAEAVRQETALLTVDKIKSTIAKNRKDVEKLEREAKFDAGDRWNAELAAAQALFKANGLDPTKPLRGINLANTELVNAQKIALREPFTGKSSKTVTPPGGTPAAQTGTPNIKQLVESSGQVYDTDKYDYRIVNGQVQRRAK